MEDPSTQTTPTPLQIVSFIPDPESPSRRILHLHQDNLAKLVAPAGQRRLAIFSIAGPSRMGKSFFLDFCIRYLQGLQDDESDWMGWSDKEKPLTGFSWKTSLEPETSGILAWPQPFILKSGEGKEIAVILLDTQGTYDAYTTEREMTAIVGLSLLASSTIMFNFSGNILEDVFGSLDTYISYGQLALGDCQQDDGLRPFQNLVFLIRDWTMVQEFPHGLKGGRGFLEKKLTPKEGMTEVGAKVRGTLRSCFSRLEACLVPGPGERAGQEGFTGALAQLSPGFCKRLEEIIDHLFNPDELEVKSVFGVELTGEDLGSYLDKYVQVFNSEDTPSPLTLLEATAKVANQTLLENCRRKYLDSMKKKMRGKPCLADPLLEKHHKFCMEDAMSAFIKAKKLGSPEIIISYEEDLRFEIKGEFDRIFTENKGKRTKLRTQSTEDALSNFQEAAIANSFAGESENFFMDEKKLKGICSSEKALAIEDFRKRLEDFLEENELAEAERQLETKITEKEDLIVQQNENRKFQAERKMEQITDECMSCFEIAITEAQYQDPHKDPEELAAFCEKLGHGAVETFKKNKEFKNMKQFYESFLQKLERKLKDKTDSIITTQALMLKDLEEGVDAELSETLQQLEKNLRQEDESGTGENLEEKADPLVSQFSQRFLERSSSFDFQSPSRFANKLKSKVEDSLRSRFRDVVTELTKKKLELEESYQQAWDDAMSYYVTELNSLIPPDTFVCEADLEQRHERYLETARQIFDNFEKKGMPLSLDAETERRDKLEREIVRRYEEIRQRNNAEMHRQSAEAETLLHKLHQNYQTEMMGNLDLAQGEEEFRDLHDYAKKLALSEFRDVYNSRFPDFASELENMIQSTFEDELVEIFELKVKDRGSGTLQAISESRRFYREEMAKHFSNQVFMRPKELEELHNRVKGLAVERAVEEASLTSLQIESLKAALEETYEGSFKTINEMNAPIDPAIGIDLGTTYSCVAAYAAGKVTVIQNEQGKNTMPSYVTYKDEGFGRTEKVVGIPSKTGAYEEMENTIFDAKRIIGRRFTDPVLQDDMKFWPFEVVDDAGVPKVKVGDERLFPEQVSAEVLKELKKVAENYLKTEVKKAVITVPAYFTDGQRQATIDAGELAGLEVLQILTEPIAAALAYKLQDKDQSSRHILVFDLGGGTFDVAVLKVLKGKLETLGIHGDTHLGGENFDKAVKDYCALQFQKDHGIDLLQDKDSKDPRKKAETRRLLKRLQIKCEEKKMELSTCRSVEINIDNLYQGRDLNVTLTRDKFEELNDALFQRTIDIVQQCLKDAGIAKEKIEDIVLVGGSTRIPRIQELLSDFFGGKALCRNINADEAVAYGAAVVAAQLNGKIASNSIDFNEIQDVTPMPLGIEVVGGFFSVIIQKNAKIPHKHTERYKTVSDNQTGMRITAYQGEDLMVARKNAWLGEFNLKNLPPRPAGQEKVDVTMQIDLQGILHVTAVSVSTGETGKMEVAVNENKGRMKREEIQRILARPAD